MTQAETTAILRQFNAWRRADEDIPQFDSRKLGEAIDAAGEMIDRLEAAESEAIEQARLNGIGSEREVVLMAKLEATEKTNREWLRANAPGGWIDNLRIENEALRAKIEQMERQEPVAVVEDDHNADGLSARISEYLPAGMMLYALPGAQPASSIPGDVMRDAKRYRFLRAAKNIPISTEAARDPVVYDAAIDAAMLARAPKLEGE